MNPTFSKVLRTTACLALASAFIASAADPGPSDSNLYKDLKAMDQNADGAVSNGEYQDGLDKRAGVSPGDFKRLDTTGDGQLSREEAGADPELTRRFQTLDQNADGYVTAAELRQ